MTAQHLRDLTQPRRAATMVAAVIRLETELADAALLMFDKLMGGLARKSERRTMESAAGALRDAQGHLRVLARAGRAMIAAHEGDADPVAAVDLAVGWARFLRAVAEAEGLARPETLDVRADLVRRWPTMRQFAPEVGVRNTEAQALYRRTGYMVRDEFPPYRPSPISLFMEKRL